MVYSDAIWYDVLTCKENLKAIELNGAFWSVLNWEPWSTTGSAGSLYSLFLKVKFVIVSSFVGRYFYDMCKVKFEIVFSFNVTIVYFHVNIILNFPITYRNAAVLWQSDCACLHQTVNMAVFFVKVMKIPTQKGTTLLQMYRVVPQTKIGNSKLIPISNTVISPDKHDYYAVSNVREVTLQWV